MMSLWPRSNPCERTSPFSGFGGSFQYIPREVKTEYTVGHCFHKQFAISEFIAKQLGVEY